MRSYDIQSTLLNVFIYIHFFIFCPKIFNVEYPVHFLPSERLLESVRVVGIRQENDFVILHLSWCVRQCRPPTVTSSSKHPIFGEPI